MHYKIGATFLHLNTIDTCSILCCNDMAV